MQFIKTDITEDKVLILYLNRPEKFNALTNDLMYELYDTIEKYKNNVNVVIIHGNEKAFAAGLDIEFIKDLSSEDLEKINFINEKWFALEKLEIPTIAAVSGYALGGGFELALMCDFIIADASSVFGFPEINIGIMPGLGGTQRLYQKIGKEKAFELMITGEKINAIKAKEFGIINEIHKNSMNTAIELANKIKNQSKSSIIAIKRALKRAAKNLEDIEFEKNLFRMLFSTKNKEIGINAFLSKTKPEFNR